MKGTANSAYIVYTQVIALGERPFVTADGLRPLWSRAFFNNETCFSDNKTLVFDRWRNAYWPDVPDEHKQRFPKEYREVRSASDDATLSNEERYDAFLRLQREWMGTAITIPRPASPFLHGLGSVFFDTHLARLTDKYSNTRSRLARLLVGNEAWDPRFLEPPKREAAAAKGEFAEDDESQFFQCFGYDPEVADQRMNALYFELSRPLILRAEKHSDVAVRGKIFVHIYPSGYLTLQVAISLPCESPMPLARVTEIVWETSPTRTDSEWKWATRIGSGKLPEVIALVKARLWNSLFRGAPGHFHEGPWQSALKVVTNANLKKAAAAIIGAKGECEALVLSKHAVSARYLISSPQGLVCVFKSVRNFGHESRRLHLRMFWKVMVFVEFVALKNQIYEDVARFLRAENLRLRQTRLSMTRKLLEEDLLRLSAYDHKLEKFLATLDKQITLAAPFHRRIYSSISKGSGFTARRDKLKELLDEWDKEIEKWDPPLMMIWKKVIAPLRALFAGPSPQ